MHDKEKMSRPVITSTVVAALGGLLFGFDTAVISGTTDALQSYFGLSEAMLGFTVASALIGTVAGSIIASRPSDIWGRNRVLFVIAGLYTRFRRSARPGLESPLFSGFFASSADWRWAARRWSPPCNIAEIAPAGQRGRLEAGSSSTFASASASPMCPTSWWRPARCFRTASRDGPPSGAGCS
jgi:MFS family permease